MDSSILFIVSKKSQFGDKGTKKKAYTQKKTRKVNFLRAFFRAYARVL